MPTASSSSTAFAESFCLGQITMEKERLDDLPSHPLDWVQGGHRFLKNNAHVVPPNIIHHLRFGTAQFPAHEAYAPLQYFPGRFGQKIDDGHGGYRLAATRLAHDAESASFSSSKDRPSTAFTRPRSVSKPDSRFSISNRLLTAVLLSTRQ